MYAFHTLITTNLGAALITGSAVYYATRQALTRRPARATPRSPRRTAQFTLADTITDLRAGGDWVPRPASRISGTVPPPGHQATETFTVGWGAAPARPRPPGPLTPLDRETWIDKTAQPLIFNQMSASRRDTRTIGEAVRDAGPGDTIGLEERHRAATATMTAAYAEQLSSEPGSVSEKFAQLRKDLALNTPAAGGDRDREDVK